MPGEQSEGVTRVVIVGAGPGGYAAAFRAADLGMEVTMIDTEPNPGGVCLYRGCIPSKALLNSTEKFIEFLNHGEEHGIKTGKIELDLSKLMQRKEKIVKQLTNGVRFLFKKNKITHLCGIASFIDKKNIIVRSSEEEKKLSAKNFIIATGSTPVLIPSIPVNKKNIIT